MDIKKLRLILNSDIPENQMEHLIYGVLSQDENVIPTIMEILKAERAIKKEGNLYYRIFNVVHSTEKNQGIYIILEPVGEKID